MDLNKLGEADLMDLRDTPNEMLRPEWDTYFMTLAYLISQRSLDKHTKHGCVVVDDARSILSVGYNSPPRGCMDSIIPLERPAKYLYMEHSESNAIVNAARSGIALKGSTFYVTGPPCHDCYRKIMNVGALKIIIGPILHQRTDDQIKAIETMGSFESSPIMHRFENMDSVFALLGQTGSYLSNKLEELENDG